MSERIQKVMARAGLGSRRSCEKLVEQGHVKVNGVRAKLGQWVAPTDEILVRGEPISKPEPVYLLLNKPAGVITTMSDPKGRPSVADLIPHYPGLHAVGRLDKDTTGLLICTTDGELTQLLTHPSHEVSKVYRVVTRQQVRPAQLRRLESGVELDDGPAQADAVRLLNTNLVEITIHSGRNRIVRRMFEAVKLDIVELHRVSVGDLSLGRLKPGDVRELTSSEVSSLKRGATQN